MTVPYMDPQGPAGPWPAEAVTARNRMVDFLNALETEAQRLYPGASLHDGFSGANPTGQTTLSLTAKGKALVLPVFQITEPWLTPDQWLAQNVPIDPPAPPPVIPGPPAAIDLLSPGDRFQKDGILFEVFETPFGNFAKRIGPVPSVAPAAQTVASVITNLVAYIKERYTLTADAEAQTELRLLLTYLAGLPK
jgi:hypothetical protein